MPPKKKLFRTQGPNDCSIRSESRLLVNSFFQVGTIILNGLPGVLPRIKTRARTGITREMYNPIKALQNPPSGLPISTIARAPPRLVARANSSRLQSRLITSLREKQVITAPREPGRKGRFSATPTIGQNRRARRDLANRRRRTDGSKPTTSSKQPSSSIRLETPGPEPESKTHSFRWDRRNATALRLRGPASPKDMHSLVDS